MASLLGAAVLALGCQRKVEPAECEKLWIHYLDLVSREVVAVDGKDGEKSSRRAQKPAAMSCSAQVTRRAYQCAMEAQSVDAVERCLL